VQRKEKIPFTAGSQPQVPLIVISCLRIKMVACGHFHLGYVAPSYESQEKSQLIEKRDEDKQGFKCCHPCCNGMVPVKYLSG